MNRKLELTPQQIAKKYVDEIITDEYLMNIGEIRDLDAISWFDETYPNLTDHQRTLFSEELDRIFPERMIAALERQNQAKEESGFVSDVEPDPQLHHLMLSTCAYSYYNERTVMHAQLVPVAGAERERFSAETMIPEQ